MEVKSKREKGKRRDKRIRRVIIFYFLIFTFAFCTSAFTQTKAAWQIEWEKTVEAAKREGQLNIEGSPVYEEVFREFQKRFGIKVVIDTAPGGEKFKRVMTERRAGKYLWDIITAGGATIYLFYKVNALDPIKPIFLLPEVIDETHWWRGRHDYFEVERRYILNFNLAPLPFVAYNDQLVNPSEIKSYWDLLNPKWKGKIVAVDPTLGPRVDLHLAFLHDNPKLGPEYLRRLLGETNLVATRDTRQAVDWLASGKYSLSVFTSLTAADLDVAKAKGLPIGWFGPKELKEGVSLSPSNGSVGFLSRAPHPAAARVAINWLLSREGQSAYQRLQSGSNSLREDIPKDTVQPFAVRTGDASYAEAYSPERTDMAAIMKIVTEAWKKKQ